MLSPDQAGQRNPCIFSFLNLSYQVMQCLIRVLATVQFGHCGCHLMPKLISVCKCDITVMFFSKLPKRKSVLDTAYKIMLPIVKVGLGSYFKQCITSRAINILSLKYSFI